MDIVSRRNKVYTTIDREFLVDENLDDKMFLVFLYLKLDGGISGKVCTTVEEIVRQIGYKPLSGKGGINDEVANILKQMADNGWISFEVGTPRRYKSFLKIRFNDSFFYKPLKNFVAVKMQEFDIIVKQPTRCRKDNLMRVYTVLKAHCWSEKGRFPSIETLSEKSGGKSNNTVGNALKELERIGLIYILNDGKYTTDDGQVKYHNNKYIFRLDEPNIK